MGEQEMEAIRAAAIEFYAPLRAELLPAFAALKALEERISALEKQAGTKRVDYDGLLK